MKPNRGSISIFLFICQLNKSLSLDFHFEDVRIIDLKIMSSFLSRRYFKQFRLQEFVINCKIRIDKKIHQCINTCFNLLFYNIILSEHH